MTYLSPMPKQYTILNYCNYMLCFSYKFYSTRCRHFHQTVQKKMATLSSFNLLSLNSPRSRLGHGNLVFRPNTMHVTPRKLIPVRPVSRVLRVYDESTSKVVTEDEFPVAPEPSEIDILKKQLLDLIHGNESGFKASAETRGEISDIVAQLEAKNPYPVLNEGLHVLGGNWSLVYTTFTPFEPFMGSSKLPLVNVQKISELIDSDISTALLSLEILIGPLSTITLSVQAALEVTSPKRIEVKFEEGIIGVPQITDWVTELDHAEFHGQQIDIPPALKSLTASFQHTATSIFSDRSPLKFPLSRETWTLVTYLEEEIKINKADGGAILVWVKG